MEIHVIRHTRLIDGLNKCYGQSDVPVADSFKADAAEMKKLLQPTYDAIFCSPLKRCLMLSEELNFNKINIEPALKEMNFGSWENQSWDDIDRNQLEKWCNDFVNERPPNGENLQDVYKRVTNFITSLKSKNYNKILLITHAGVIRCIHAFFNNIALDKIFNIPVGFNEIFVYNT
ncbi:MAG TPA: alpha-ribazole phosphatase [Bacteroidales bacterium]|nr:alpha-ribazole phosphatase [Bacteroidales bacterium]HQO07015.1 alpha-ribazole phosphatase [Bacteroidales bacterium]HQP52780.1 alpha-ribazole phosphatase [Bacteroidales bacterium]